MSDQEHPPTDKKPEPDQAKRMQTPAVEPIRMRGASWFVLGVAATLGGVFLVSSLRNKTESPKITGDAASVLVSGIEKLANSGQVELCDAPKRGCRAAEKGAALKPGMTLGTNDRARARMDVDGADRLELDRATKILLSKSAERTIELEQGVIEFDSRSDDPKPFRVSTPLGQAEINGAQCAIFHQAEQTRLEVMRGQIRFTPRKGQTETLRAGETGRLRAGQTIKIDRMSGGGESLIAEDPATDAADEGTLAPGLGELRAKKPGENQERANAVRLVRHRVNAHVVGAIARTEIEEIFTNQTDEVLEGIFRMPLPADAQIERLALEVDGQLVEGAFADRERASAIWRGSIVNAAPQLRQQIRDEIVWVPGPWRDPALLEWQRGNRFELRIYPIPKQGSRRIVLAYTQIVPAVAGQRRYSYPLPQRSSEQNSIDDFSFNLELRGHDSSQKPTVTGYVGQLANNGTDGARLTVQQAHFLPQGSLVVDYELPSAEKDLIAWAHQPKEANDAAYVAMLLRPDLPRSSERKAKNYAFVVDTSRSMYGENQRRAVALTVRMISELSSDDQVTVLGCDSDCRTWPPGLISGGSNAARQAKSFLKEQSAEGASDLALAVQNAMDALARSDASSQEIFYVGDGTPTAGPTRAATLVRETRRLFDGKKARLTAVAVGADSDLQSLRAIASGSRGVVLPYVPGTSIAKAAQAAIGSSLGTRLFEAKLELPQGITGIAHESLDTIAAGSELLITGRMSVPVARGDVVLRGRVGEQQFEQRYSIELKPTAGERNAFVPRLYAGARIAELERVGNDNSKKEAIELSRQFSVASRYTSLLVLESPAMFKAFGLDNQRRAETWTGELEDSSTSADAVEEKNGQDEDAPQGLSNGASSGVGGGHRRGAGLAMAPKPSAADDLYAPAAAEAAAPAPAAPAAAQAKRESAAKAASGAADFESSFAMPPPSAPQKPSVIARPRPRPMIPMRRIWERRGEVMVGRTVQAFATFDKVTAAERELQQNPDLRKATKKLFDLYFASGELSKASELAERWSSRDPLDVDALVARADLAARLGNRSDAIRILGSVIDVRPSDFGAQQRLSRLYRWQGQAARACRFSLALAEFRVTDEKAVAEALQCLGESGQSELAQILRGTLTDKVLGAVEAILRATRPSDSLSGDLRITATFSSANGVDVDLSLIDPDAHRVSWLGAPTRSVISAIKVTNTAEEGLSLRGAKPGEYLLELTRGYGQGTVSGTVTVSVAGTQRQIPFTLDRERVVLGIVKLTMVPRLIPLEQNIATWTD